MSASLRIHVFGTNGEPNDRGILDWLYLTDLDGEPFWSQVRIVAPGLIEVTPTRPDPVQIHAFWEIEGFGRVFAIADNDGGGYLAGRDVDVDLNRDLASSRLARTRRRLAELGSAYSFDRPTLGRVEEAEALLKRAASADAPRERVTLLGRSHGLGAWALEEIEVAKARQDVARMPAERRQALHFGCNSFDYKDSEAYRQRFVEVFDFATVPFYRRLVEPVEGQIDWKTRDDMLDWIESQKLTPKGHPLFWGHEAGEPTWMKRLAYPTFKEVVHREIVETVRRYRDRIKIWDVINEAHDHAPANVLFFRRDEQLEMTALAARATREADPDAIRIVNNCATWSEYVAWRERDKLMSVYEYLTHVLDQGIDFEVIGLQMYYPRRDMADISAQFDRFARFGKPLHITELGTPSAIREKDWRGLKPEDGWWHGPWSQSVQADWVEQYYLIAASKPAIEAITWWDLTDKDSFIQHGGFLDEQDQPKESFSRLKKVIQQIRQSG